MSQISYLGPGIRGLFLIDSAPGSVSDSSILPISRALLQLTLEKHLVANSALLR